MRRSSPAVRWTREHGRKRSHATRHEAWKHTVYLLVVKRAWPLRYPYPCYWGHWYQLGEKKENLHYHVGRKPTKYPRARPVL